MFNNINICYFITFSGQQGSFELKFKTTELAEEWKNELEKLSVKRHNTPKLHKRSLNKLTPSKQLDRHIENIKGFVDSYSNIMKETFR